VGDQRISAEHERHSRQRYRHYRGYRSKTGLNTVTEIGSLVAHPPQLFIRVLQPARSGGSLHDGLSSCVYSVVGDDHDR
jgi:hypothetical protein